MAAPPRLSPAPVSVLPQGLADPAQVAARMDALAASTRSALASQPQAAIFSHTGYTSLRASAGAASTVA